MQWDFKDQLQATSQQVRNDGGKPEITYFVYDASGQRVRKVTERQADAGQSPRRMKERIYLGGFEIYREYNGDGTTVTLERETLHIMDDQQRIALVETRTKGNDDSPRQLIRYQLGNHLGSASLELSDLGAIVSYEEYYPYGSTSYQGGRSVAEVGLKRYRYTGKERDGETGLYYHGARYYAAWLGRWVSCDPIGIAGGINVFVYTSNSPINRIDPNGMEDCTASSFVCDPAKYKPSSSSSKAAAFGSKEWEAKERLKMETELSLYGQGSINNESLSDLQSRLFQARAKATLAKQDMAPVQTVNVESGPAIHRGIIVVHPSAVDAIVREEVEFVGTDEQRAAKQIEVGVEASENSFKAAVGGALQMGAARQANKAAGQPQIDPRLKQSGAPVDNTPVVAPAPATPTPTTPSLAAPKEAPPVHSQFVLFSRSKGEADAFRRTVNQIEGLELPPPPKLGGPKANGSIGKWGSNFGNRPLQPGRTPELPAGIAPFKEYTSLMPNAQNRGPLRIVSGDGGKALFNTWTHYGEDQPFFPIDPTAPLPRITFLRFR
jgi:RHS repeat-associated protein